MSAKVITLSNHRIATKKTTSNNEMAEVINFNEFKAQRNKEALASGLKCGTTGEVLAVWSEQVKSIKSSANVHTSKISSNQKVELLKGLLLWAVVFTLMCEIVVSVATK